MRAVDVPVYDFSRALAKRNLSNGVRYLRGAQIRAKVVRSAWTVSSVEHAGGELSTTHQPVPYN